MRQSPASPPPRARHARRRLLQLALGALAALPLVAVAAVLRRREPPAGTDGLTVSVPDRTATLAVPAVPATPGPRAPTPTAAPTPLPLAVELRPPQLGAGEAMRVRTRAPGAASASVQFRGREHPLVLLADGGLWGVVGAPLEQAPGELTLTVTARAATGAVIGVATVPTAVVAVERPVDYLQTTEAQAAVLTLDAQAREDALRAQQFATFDPAPRWSGVFTRPTDGEFTTRFGQGRSINGGPVGGFHSGTDFAEDEGVLVRAAAAGRVAWAGAMPIRGNSVVLDHGGGVKSGYHHLSAIAVAPGEATIAAGTVIGAVGATGFATGPHLHWELTVWGVNVDPVTWLTEPFGP